MNHQVRANLDGNRTKVKNKVQSVKFGHVNIYFIETGNGHILVDAGMPMREKELDRAFDANGVDPKTVHLIVATHGHLDHVGSIAYAQKITGGKVLCHRAAADYIESGEAEPATARNFMGHILNFLTVLSGSKFEGITPDIVIDDEYDLRVFGIEGKIVHTPGHSPSSVAIILESGEILIGDMVREESSGQIGLGMFYENKVKLLESLEKLASYKPRIIYLSHGNTIDNRTLRTAISANR